MHKINILDCKKSGNLKSPKDIFLTSLPKEAKILALPTLATLNKGVSKICFTTRLCILKIKFCPKILSPSSTMVELIKNIKSKTIK